MSTSIRTYVLRQEINGVHRAPRSFSTRPDERLRINVHQISDADFGGVRIILSLPFLHVSYKSSTICNTVDAKLVNPSVYASCSEEDSTYYIEIHPLGELTIPVDIGVDPIDPRNFFIKDNCLC